MRYTWNPNHLKNERGNRKASSYEVCAMLGLAPKQGLPVEGMQGRYIQGIWVWVEPLRHEDDPHRRGFHRVLAMCPVCHRIMSAGRLHQHRCKGWYLVFQSETADGV